MKTSSTQRLYYSIKEVGELFDEEQHILRYWEREFDCLRPSKNRAGNRTYTEKDLDVIRVIKKLLRVDRIPVSEARALLHRGVTDEMVRDAVRGLKIHSTIDAVDVLPNSSSTSVPDAPAKPAKPASTGTAAQASIGGIQHADTLQLVSVLKSIVQELELLAE